jgi:hypothetical protein
MAIMVRNLQTMAYLNTQERDALLTELKSLDFLHAKRKLMTSDKKGRLRYFRNSQRSGFLETSFDLEGLGTRVTLIEKHDRTPSPKKEGVYDSHYEMVDVIVEPLPDNSL